MLHADTPSTALAGTSPPGTPAPAGTLAPPPAPDLSRLGLSEPPPGAFPTMLVTTLFVVLVVGALSAWLSYWRLTASPRDRALRALGWRAGLRSRDRAALAALARAAGVPHPLGLLASRSALSQALDRHAASITPAAASRLRARVVDRP